METPGGDVGSDTSQEPDLNGDLKERLEGLLCRAEELCEKCDQHTHIPGMNKLRKKCEAEKQFLCRVRKKKKLDLAQLSSTNLSHLEAVWTAAVSLPHVVQVLQPFTHSQDHQTVVVDVVCNHGYTWVKVIARKAQALHLIWAGQGQFGEKSILDQAMTYQTCAALYPVSFATPQVLFLFTNGVTPPLADALVTWGVVVFGERVNVGDSVQRQLDAVRANGDSGNEDSSDADSSVPSLLVTMDCDESDTLKDAESIPTASELFSSLKMTDNLKSKTECCDKDPENPGKSCDILSIKNSARNQSGSLLHACDPSDRNRGDTTYDRVSRLARVSLRSLMFSAPVVRRVNIDITTLICLASNVCHGQCHLVFADDVLTQQAQWERERPVLPKLKDFMEDKELYVCETAVSDFHSILDTVGGPMEKQRAAELIARVTVIPDRVSERVSNLNLSHQVKQRAKTIFGTGDHLQAVTMTANSGFVRSAMKQGINFAVFLHESRALTEQKEQTAVPIQHDS